MDRETKRKLRWFWVKRSLLTATAAVSFCIATLAVFQLRAIHLEKRESEKYWEKLGVDLPSSELSEKLQNWRNCISGSTECQELSRELQESSRRLQELSRELQESSIKYQELSRGLQERSRELQELSRELQESSRELQELERKFVLNLALLLLAALIFTLFYLWCSRLRSPLAISPTGHLICIFPEECVAELEAYRQHLIAQENPRWRIQAIIFLRVTETLFAFAWINVENLWLPHWNTTDRDE